MRVFNVGGGVKNKGGGTQGIIHSFSGGTLDTRQSPEPSHLPEIMHLAVKPSCIYNHDYQR